MEMLFVLFALAWIITVYVRRLTAGQGRPYIDILGPPVGPPPVVGVVVPPPSYGIPPATSVVLGSSGNLGIITNIQHKCLQFMDSQEQAISQTSLI